LRRSDDFHFGLLKVASISQLILRTTASHAAEVPFAICALAPDAIGHFSFIGISSPRPNLRVKYSPPSKNHSPVRMLPMVRSLDELFEDHILIRPSDETPNLVHLVRAIATLNGVSEMGHAPIVQRLIELIGPCDHLVFVLCDGLGMNLIERLAAQSFLASHMRQTLSATCPSTTACALTSVATADYPARHGVTGWFTELPEFGLTAMMLPFAERFTKSPLRLKIEQVLPVAPFASRMRREALTLLPTPIAHTLFATWSRGNGPGAGYNSIGHGIDQVIERVTSARAPTYTHLYLPDVDTLCHHIGAGNPDVLPLVVQIDEELSRLADALADVGKGGARVVISADHGLIDVPPSEQVMLRDGDPLLEMLRVPPTGDARMPIFHVKPDRPQPFAAAFGERFGDRMVLLTTDQADSMRLFGSGPMTGVARRRFGDFIAFPFRPAALAYAPVTANSNAPYIGLHGGLSPEEMRIPLILA
jgi:hypothetical protein